MSESTAGGNIHYGPHRIETTGAVPMHLRKVATIEQVAEMGDRIAELEAKNAELRKALLFYADIESYDEYADPHPLHGMNRPINVRCDATHDRGQRARAALATQAQPNKTEPTSK